LLWTRAAAAAIFPTPANMPGSSPFSAGPSKNGLPSARCADLLFKEEQAMGNDARMRKRTTNRLKSSRKLLLIVAVLAVLLPLGIVALSRSHADDGTASGGAAPALTPLPPVQPFAKQIPTPPADAASTTASDDTSPAQTAETKPLRTPPPTNLPLSDRPSTALPSPAQPAIARPLPGPASSTDVRAASLHVDVLPQSDWAQPAPASADAKTQSASGTGLVTPASAAIPETASAVAPANIAIQAESDLPALPSLQVEAARFKDIQPGVTTTDELIERWGEGKLLRQKDGTVQREYNLETYPRVTVSLERKRVSVIDVRLEEPTEPVTLAQRLRLDTDSSVPVLDDAGQLLGQSYPDRGILFSFDSGTKLVSQMLLEPIDPQPFLVRAATEGDLHPGWGLRDVDYALQLDAKHAESHDMRAQMLLSIGRPGEALKAANRAIELAPEKAAFVLTKATILARLDRRSEAVKLTQSVIDRADLPPLLKAHALCQLAELSAGPAGDDKRVIELYMSAIKTAQPLVSDERFAVRRLAKHLLLDAHLGAATDIAWGVWQKKSATVARWIQQADQLAQDLIDHEEADPKLRLDVARRAMSAAAGTDGKWDAADWTQQALDTGRKLIAEADDPLRKEALQWELGAALVDALEVQRTAGLNAQSLAHAMAVLKYLQAGIQYRQRTPECTYILGRAYFQIGVIHAVVQRDHTTAVLWFDRATPFLDRPLPPSAASRIGRNGELLVSMGISYWQTGHREEGLRLTQRGTDLMSRAVAMKLLNDGALAVPYGNLAAMHKQMGHSEQARSYSEMAAQHDPLQR
jgi:tetratricopeptide (TPR) repeat protein